MVKPQNIPFAEALYKLEMAVGVLITFLNEPACQNIPYIRWTIADTIQKIEAAEDRITSQMV